MWDGSVLLEPSWSHNPSTGVCSTPVTHDITALFLDGDLMTAARWPNALWSDKTIFNSSFWRPTQTGSERGVVVDEELSQSGLDMTGAMAVLNIGSWETFVAEVSSHKEGSDKFTYNDTFGDIKFIVAHNRYYLEGSLALLDAAGEWVYDRTSRLLHLIPPMGRACADLTDLRGRVQDHALTIAASSNITIANITFFSSNIHAQGQANILLDSLNFAFPSSSHRMLGSTAPPLSTHMDVEEGGIVVNCTFHGGEGEALVITGNNGLLTNNLFTYNDWAVQGNIGTVMSKCRDCTFSHNTLSYNGAAHGLRYTGRRDIIEMNLFEGQCSGTIQNDGASIQVSPAAQDGVTVRYNWVHESPKKGIRFDGDGVGNGCGRGGYLGYNVGWAVHGNAELAPKALWCRQDNHRPSKPPST